MSRSDVQVAARIRELREILELTEEEVAASLDIPVDAYRIYESAEGDPPISVMYNLSKLFGVDMTTLLTGDIPHMDTYSLVRAHEGAVVQRHPGYSYEDLAYNYIGRTMEPMVVFLEEQAEPPKLLHHTGQEFNYVLEGEVRIVMGGKEFILHTGDAMYFNPSIPHAQYCTRGKARFLTVIQHCQD